MQSLFFLENKDVLYNLDWKYSKKPPAVKSLTDICSQYIVMDATTTLNVIKIIPRELLYK